MTETLTRTAASVAASALLTAVTHASNAVSKRPAVPVMAGLRLSTQGGRLHVTGYDYDLRITREVPILGDIADVLVPADTLLKAVKNLDKKADVDLSVTVSEGALVLTQGKRVITLGGLPIEEYPELPEPGGERTFAITPESLKFAAEKVLPFSGKDDMLPVLSRTVHFSFDGTTLTVGSTDRFRAALAEMPAFVVGIDGPVEFIVPDLHRFAVAFDTPDQMVAIATHSERPAGGEWVSFWSQDVTVTVRTVDGSFPKLGALFPSEFTLNTIFDAVEMGKALKFVSLAVEKNSSVVVEIDGDHITLTGDDGDTNMTDDVPVTVYGRDADLTLRTGYNPDFLGDVLKVFGKATVTMHHTAAQKPALFTSESAPGLRVLLMPRRLKEDS